jgi:gliding motility associated protien GldN
MTIKKFIFGTLCLLIASASFAQIEQDDRESGSLLEDIYIDDVVKNTLVEESMVLEYEPVREADITWKKRIWRVIDTREKMNLPFRYPNEPFFNILREIAENGDIALFRDEAFTEPMTMDEINGTLNKIDTVVTFDYETYEEKIQIVQNTINWEDIKQFRVKEVWYFDKESSRMDVRILGISPILDEIDYDTGELKYSLPLFWVYYPEARQYFAKHRVYNQENDMAPMSWYDLFENRFFASYIIKKSNSLDLRVADMYDGYDQAGVDRLMESEKIKMELFNLEHDLWTY